jgi:hypothetical protein
VHERDAAAVAKLRDDLMPEHRARVGRIELLDVGAAEPARDDGNRVSRAVRLGDLGELRLALRADDDGTHARIVGSFRRKESDLTLKLHRCPAMWAKYSGHPCWRVQSALDAMGVEYEVVKEAWPRRSKRTAVIEGTGQRALPAIELADGTWYRERSADMARAIRAGRFGPGA